MSDAGLKTKIIIDDAQLKSFSKALDDKMGEIDTNMKTMVEAVQTGFAKVSKAFVEGAGNSKRAATSIKEDAKSIESSSVSYSEVAKSIRELSNAYKNGNIDSDSFTKKQDALYRKMLKVSQQADATTTKIQKQGRYFKSGFDDDIMRYVVKGGNISDISTSKYNIPDLQQALNIMQNKVAVGQEDLSIQSRAITMHSKITEALKQQQLSYNAQYTDIKQIEALDEKSAVAIDAKLKALKNYQATLVVDTSNADEVRNNQVILTQIEKLKQKRKELSTIKTPTFKLDDALMIKPSSINKNVANLKKLKALRDSLTKTSDIKKVNDKIKELTASNKKLASISNEAVDPIRELMKIKIDKGQLNVGTMNISELKTALSIIQQKIKLGQIDIEAQGKLVVLQKRITDELKVQQTAYNANTTDIKTITAMEERSIDALDKKIAALENYQRTNKIDDKNDKEILNNQKLLKQLDDLKRKRDRLSKIRKPRMSFEEAIGIKSSSISKNIYHLGRLRELRDNLTDVTKISRVNHKIEELTNNNNKLANAGKKIQQTHTSALNTADQLTRRLALAFSVSQISRYIGQLVKVRGEFELQQRALEAIIQNKDKADRLFAKISQLAVKSPFRFKNIITYTKQLAAYRIETEQLYEWTKKLGDVSAGVGVSMDRLVLAFGQVKAANYLRGQELRQFSEAGINILGELADKFSEVEGRAVSTGEVFEMVSKRMVSFEDVAEVFNKITSEGGIFYHMQEIQAETLKGKISNLNDAFDLLLNEVGTDAQGFLSGIVDSIRFLVDNSSIIIGLVTSLSIGFAGYAAAALKSAGALRKLSSAELLVIANGRGIKAVIARIISGLKSLKAVFLKNWWIAAAAAVLGIVMAFKKMHDHVKQAREEMYTIVKELDNSQKASNKLINKLIELTDAQGEGNEATEEQIAILIKLKKEYPSLYGKIDTHKLKIDNLKESQKEYNEELAISKKLQYWVADSITIFNDGLAENSKKYKIAVNSFSEYSQIVKSRLPKLIELYSEALETSKKRTYGINMPVARAKFRALESILEKSKQLMNNYNAENLYAFDRFLNKQENMLRHSLHDRPKFLKEFRKGMYAEFDNFANVGDTLSKSFIKLKSNIAEVFKSLAVDVKMQGGTTEEQINKIKKGIKDILKYYNIGDERTKSFILDLAKKEFKVDIQLDYKEVEKGRTEFNKMVNSIADLNKVTHKENFFKIANESLAEYIKRLSGNRKALQDEVERIKKMKISQTMAISDEIMPEGYTLIGKTNKERISDNKKLIKTYTEILKILGVNDNINKASNKRLKEKVELLKKAHSLWKEQHDAGIKEPDIYTPELTGMFQDIGLVIDTSVEFDKEGTIRQLNAIALGASKEGRKIIEKNILDIKYENIKDKVKAITDDIQKAIDSNFSNYQLGLQFDEFKVPKKIAEDLFDIKFIDRNILEKDMNRYLDMLETQGIDSTKIREKYSKQLQKIDETSQSKRISSYLKTLEEYSSTEDKISEIKRRAEAKRIQIEKDTMGQSGELRKKLLDALSKETMTSISKVNFEDFKRQSGWADIFSSIDTQSIASLETMLNNLQNELDKNTELTVTDMKAIGDAMDKIREQISQKNPFEAFGVALKSLMENTEKIKNLKDFRQGLVDANKSLGIPESVTKQSELYLNTTEKINKTEADSEKQKVSLSKSFKALAQTSNNIASNLNNLSKIFEGLFGKGATTDMLDSVADGFKVVGQMASLAAMAIAVVDTVSKEFLTTNPFGWILLAAAAVIAVLTTILSFGEKQKTAKIKHHQDSVDKLADSYNDLKDAMDKAYDLDQILTYNKGMAHTLDLENQQLAAMKKIEESKKDSDESKIKEYERKIKENNKIIQENAEALSEKLGNLNLANAVYEFADAWEEAYMSGENTLDALNGKMDEFVRNLIKKQAALLIVGKFIEPLKKMVDNLYKDGRLSQMDIATISDSAAKVSGLLNEAMSNYYENMGQAARQLRNAESKLQLGVQNITEDTGEIIAGSMNTIIINQGKYLDLSTEIRNINADTNRTIKSMFAEANRYLKTIRDSLDSVISIDGQGRTSVNAAIE